MGEPYAGERCEGGMKMTQFVLSSCEKKECKMKEGKQKREREVQGQTEGGEKGLRRENHTE